MRARLHGKGTATLVFVVSMGIMLAGCDSKAPLDFLEVSAPIIRTQGIALHVDYVAVTPTGMIIDRIEVLSRIKGKKWSLDVGLDQILLSGIARITTSSDRVGNIIAVEVSHSEDPNEPYFKTFVIDSKGNLLTTSESSLKVSADGKRLYGYSGPAPGLMDVTGQVLFAGRVYRALKGGVFLVIRPDDDLFAFIDSFGNEICHLNDGNFGSTFADEQFDLVAGRKFEDGKNWIVLVDTSCRWIIPPGRLEGDVNTWAELIPGLGKNPSMIINYGGRFRYYDGSNDYAFSWEFSLHKDASLRGSIVGKLQSGKALILKMRGGEMSERPTYINDSLLVSVDLETGRAIRMAHMESDNSGHLQLMPGGKAVRSIRRLSEYRKFIIEYDIRELLW